MASFPIAPVMKTAPTEVDTEESLETYTDAETTDAENAADVLTTVDCLSRYTIQTGDNLFTIGREYGQTPERLQYLNPAAMDIYNLVPGEIICLEANVYPRKSPPTGTDFPSKSRTWNKKIKKNFFFCKIIILGVFISGLSVFVKNLTLFLPQPFPWCYSIFLAIFNSRK